MPTNPFQYIFPGVIATEALYAAVDLNIPDLLVSDSKTAAELAPGCGAHEQTLERLLCDLTSLGMFRSSADGRYSNTLLTEVRRGLFEIHGSIRNSRIYCHLATSGA